MKNGTGTLPFSTRVGTSDPISRPSTKTLIGAETLAAAALKALEQVALPLATGLPLDAGIGLQRAAQRLERLHQSGHGGVLANFVTLLQLVQ